MCRHGPFLNQELEVSIGKYSVLTHAYYYVQMWIFPQTKVVPHNY